MLYCSMLYHVGDFLTDQTLSVLYHIFACSRVSYGIIDWGTITDKFLKETESKLNYL